MQLEKWFTTDFTLFRFTGVTDSGGSFGSNMTAVTTFKGHIYPMDGTESPAKEKVEGLTFFKILCGITVNVQQKDRISDGTNNYEVVSAVDRNIGRNPHKEIVTKLRDE